MEEIKNNFESIICPKCGSNCIIDFNNYKINLSQCKYFHKINDIYLDEFENIQNIYKSNIFCDYCNKYKIQLEDNDFYLCNKCNITLCQTCKSNHFSDHFLLNYNQINYKCDIHNMNFTSYCQNCNINLCDICLREHNKSHSQKYYTNIFTSNEDKQLLKKLNLKIDTFKKNINDLINILNKVLRNIEAYNCISNNILNNKEYTNYQILMNKISIHNYNQLVLNDINQIINESNNIKKFEYIYELYNKMKSKCQFLKSNYNSNINNSYNNYYNINSIDDYIIDNIYQNNINNINCKNKITISYKINQIQDKLTIFGDDFVRNNINKCSMIYLGKNCEITTSIFDVKNKLLNNLLTIKLLGIDNISNISYMFSNCLADEIIINDINNLNISTITNMDHMFFQCYNLLSIPDISKINTSKAKNISSMFYNCKKLKSLPDISKWDTSNINNMSYLFYNCQSLESLPDLSKWNTYNLVDIKYLFYNCSKLTYLPYISRWNTSKVAFMNFLFYNCSSLLYLPDISKWDTSSVTNMSSLFANCSNLSYLPKIDCWNVLKVTDMNYMFKNCKSLKAINISSWNLDRNNYKSMFQGTNIKNNTK